MRLRTIPLVLLITAGCIFSPVRGPFEPLRARFGSEELVEAGEGGVVPTLPGESISYPVVASAPFERLLVSWNVDLPPGTGYEVELRVRPASGAWSPWLFLDAMGAVPEEIRGARRSSCYAGRVDVDEFVAASPQRSAQLRFHLHGPARVRRMAFSFQGISEEAAPAPMTTGAPGGEIPAALLALPLPVPPRSQYEQDASIAGRICAPTSLAMVLAFEGVDVPVETIAARTFDPVHDIYGNWPRAIETAWSFGVPGRVARLSSLRDLEPSLAAGHPVILSIAFGPLELPGAPIGSTDGHLLVVRGFDAAGDVLVADPAAPDRASVLRTYPREAFARAWLGHGGVALLFGV